MKQRFWIYLLTIFFSTFASQAMFDEESDGSGSCLSLGSVSEYDDGTIQAANEGFFHWEEREFKAAEPFLKEAAGNRYTASMYKYALILLDPEHLALSPHMKTDIFQAADYMLMAAMRANEMAIDFVEDLDKQVKKITRKRNPQTGMEITSLGLLEVIKTTARTKTEAKSSIRKWLRGELGAIKSYPSHIRDALKLFFISILPKLGHGLLEKLEAQVITRIRELAQDEGSTEDKPLLPGKKVTQLHGYAAVTLGLKTEISEVPRYTGEAQSARIGAHNYTYYNTRHKYPYEFDICTRTLNCRPQANRELLSREDARLVTAQAEPFTAGPHYEGLSNWQEKGNEPQSLGRPTDFLVDSFYRSTTNIFYGHPLWLVETTHMETPWEAIRSRVETHYDSKWPHTTGQWSRNDPECQKRTELKEHFKERTRTYIESGRARDSLFYYLFLISAVDKSKRAISLSEDNKNLAIDLRYVSRAQLLEHTAHFDEVEVLTLKHGSSFQKEWLKELNLPKCQRIKYTLDQRQSHKSFEKALCRLRTKKKISIENLEGPTPIETPKTKRKKAEAEASSSKKVKKEKVDYSKGESMTLDMKDYTQDTIKEVLPYLRTKKKIEILNLSTTNQTWVIADLKQNPHLTTEDFAYTVKPSKKGSSPKPLRKIEKFVKTLSKPEEGAALEKETKRPRKASHDSSDGSSGRKRKKKKEPVEPEKL